MNFISLMCTLFRGTLQEVRNTNQLRFNNCAKITIITTLLNPSIYTKIWFGSFTVPVEFFFKRDITS